MLQPEYLICLECETPAYTFEWEDGRVVEAYCQTCGNEDPTTFVTEDELEELSDRGTGDDD
jgi:translation initiation factor 2 beta subunit (eIF-2beta)/eIF-5